MSSKLRLQDNLDRYKCRIQDLGKECLNVKLYKIESEMDKLEWDKNHGYSIDANLFFVLQEQWRFIHDRIIEPDLLHKKSHIASMKENVNQIRDLVKILLHEV